MNEKISMKTPTIDLKGKSYATVPARIKEFREACPHGSIETKPTMLEGGAIMFSTTIIKDLSYEFSARATGTSMGKGTGEKAFEKLETISVGRALALLGYMASGDIASSEEMEEFNAFKQEKKDEVISNLKSANSLDQLKEIFMGLGNFMSDVDVIKTKDEMKVKLTPKKVKVEEGEVAFAEIPLFEGTIEKLNNIKLKK
jgi:hypothetical protein